jgi:hypothetical protein
MPLRIAFDLDGVLADMEGELVRQAEVLFGPAIARRLSTPAGAPAKDAAPDASGTGEPTQMGSRPMRHSFPGSS